MSSAESGGDGADDPYDVGTKWEGYSNYEAVSRDMSMAVSNAVDAFATLQGSEVEGAIRNPEAVARARADITAAALRLYVELAEESDNDEQYEEMLERWGGPLADTEGFLDEMREVSLYDGVPDWLFQFVVDIRTAGWELGYLKAGRRTRETPNDPVEGETEEMFSEL